MAQPIVYFEIVGHDADSLRDYYAGLFGWRFDGDSTPCRFEHAAVATHGAGIAGAFGSALPGTDGYLTFYVAVGDVEATLALAESLGGSRLYGPERVHALEFGMLADPEGHLIGVLAALPDTPEADSIRSAGR
jgi:uncharacterized protein